MEKRMKMKTILVGNEYVEQYSLFYDKAHLDFKNSYFHHHRKLPQIPFDDNGTAIAAGPQVNISTEIT